VLTCSSTRELAFLDGSHVYKELESCIRLTVSSSRCFTLNNHSLPLSGSQSWSPSA
jgi:hypothetical protein